MPNQSYLPSREAELLTWSTNFNNQVQADSAGVGLSAEQATALNTAQTAFASAYDTAHDPITRSPLNIQLKNEKKAALIALVRQDVAIIQAFPGTTDAQRTALGITVRDNTPTPAPIPATSPVVTVAAVEGRLFNLELREVGSERRGKPAGVKCAWIYTYVGEDLPTFEQMTFRGSTGKTDTKIVLPADTPVGSKVWISACWVNTAEKPGAVSLPIFTSTNYGPMQNNAA